MLRDSTILINPSSRWTGDVANHQQCPLSAGGLLIDPPNRRVYIHIHASHPYLTACIPRAKNIIGLGELQKLPLAFQGEQLLHGIILFHRPTSCATAYFTGVYISLLLDGAQMCLHENRGKNLKLMGSVILYKLLFRNSSFRRKGSSDFTWGNFLRHC